MRFDWMFVSCMLQVASARPGSKQSELVGVSVCGNCKRRKPGLQMSTVSRRNTNFNTRKTLEPPLKQSISAIKHSLLLHLVGDYVINLGCDLNTLIWIGLLNLLERDLTTGRWCKSLWMFWSYQLFLKAEKGEMYVKASIGEMTWSEKRRQRFKSLGKMRSI
jgi:hypothetical protein